MREKWWSRGGPSAATAVAMTFAVGACNGTSSATTPSDAAPPSDTGTTEPLEGGSSPGPDASNVPDASSDDTSPDAGASTDAGEAGSPCSTDGGLAAAGNYVASDGTQYWLRKSATAATFTFVPGGTPANTSPPHLARIREVCSQWLGIAGTDGTFARVDWASVTGGLLLCPRSVTSLDAAATLPGANPNDADAGCGGNPWISLTPVSP
jgi:hypothetical protein